jgi:hypothetical protein
MITVKAKDRKNEVEMIRMALNMCNIAVGYQHADLINRIVTGLQKTKGNMSIREVIEIHNNWLLECEQYERTIVKASEET